jgi:hypothetical protein
MKRMPIIALLAAVAILALGEKAHATVYFEEDFSGTTLDPFRWSASRVAGSRSLASRGRVPSISPMCRESGALFRLLVISRSKSEYSMTAPPTTEEG